MALVKRVIAELGDDGAVRLQVAGEFRVRIVGACDR
jgi:hypothetical protein